MYDPVQDLNPNYLFYNKVWDVQYKATSVINKINNSNEGNQGNQGNEGIQAITSVGRVKWRPQRKYQLAR
jgi:hypothetical protein